MCCPKFWPTELGLEWEQWLTARQSLWCLGAQELCLAGLPCPSDLFYFRLKWDKWRQRHLAPWNLLGRRQHLGPLRDRDRRKEKAQVGEAVGHEAQHHFQLL